MKYVILVTIVLFSFSINQCLCQSFINGDFEFNTSVGCDYNLTDSEFNTRISNVTAFGKGYSGAGYFGEVDIQTSGCYIIPQNGNWCLGLQSDTAATSDAITIKLDSSLSLGITYELSFYIYGNTNFSSTTANIEIGESLTDTLFGILIDSITPDTNNWKFVSMTFTATQNSNYISVRTKVGIYGWTQIDNFSINVYNKPSPTIDLGNDTTLCQGESITLDATKSNATYLWQDNSTDSTFTVTQQGSYWVDVTVNNCKVSDTIIIDFEDCSCILYVPNSFTPNFDNNNDHFSPILDCNFKEYTFVIFNRWGEKIFETNDYNDSWDGIYQEKLCPSGVYVYLVRYKYDISYEQEYGTVTLLK